VYNVCRMEAEYAKDNSTNSSDAVVFTLPTSEVLKSVFA
jgi:hypothetical protein